MNQTAGLQCRATTIIYKKFNCPLLSQKMARRTGRPLGSCFGDPCSNPQCPISPLFLFELKHGIPCIKYITSYNELQTMCSVMERWCSFLTRRPGFLPPLLPFFLNHTDNLTKKSNASFKTILIIGKSLFYIFEI